jgi:hypothetical protein
MACDAYEGALINPDTDLGDPALKTPEFPVRFKLIQVLCRQVWA